MILLLEEITGREISEAAYCRGGYFEYKTNVFFGLITITKKIDAYKVFKYASEMARDMRLLLVIRLEETRLINNFDYASFSFSSGYEEKFMRGVSTYDRILIAVETISKLKHKSIKWEDLPSDITQELYKT